MSGSRPNRLLQEKMKRSERCRLPPLDSVGRRRCVAGPWRESAAEIRKRHFLAGIARVAWGPPGRNQNNEVFRCPNRATSSVSRLWMKPPLLSTSTMLRCGRRGRRHVENPTPQVCCILASGGRFAHFVRAMPVSSLFLTKSLTNTKRRDQLPRFKLFESNIWSPTSGVQHMESTRLSPLP